MENVRYLHEKIAERPMFGAGAGGVVFSDNARPSDAVLRVQH